jgi:putative oxidoreductase
LEHLLVFRFNEPGRIRGKLRIGQQIGISDTRRSTVSAIGFAAFSASLAAKGLAYADAWAAAAVAIEVLAPLALILGAAPRSTSLVLIAFVIMATATSHRYWEFADPVAHRAQEVNFYKNGAILGGLLYYFVSGAGTWSIAGWRLVRAAKPRAA